MMKKIDTYKIILRKHGKYPMLLLVLSFVAILEFGWSAGLRYCAIMLLFLAHFLAAHFVAGLFVRGESISSLKVLAFGSVLLGDTVLIHHGSGALVSIFILMPTLIVVFVLGRSFLGK